MKNRALLSALAVCFIAAGCDKKADAPPPPKAAAAVTPLPPAAPQAPAASANQDATPAQPAQVAMASGKRVGVPSFKGSGGPLCDGGGANCEVEVDAADAGSGCTIAKNPPRVKAKKGSAQTIKWRMKQGSTWQLDKVVFADAGAPFSCQSNGPQIHCNTPNNDTQPTEYDYVVHVKKGGQTCSSDPMIVNGADTATP
jgi:hypothetical protein